jgi:cytoskeleton protein RodZ
MSMSKTVGEQLQEARIARGLTFEQAAQSTRIRKPFLEALERDDQATLPSAVQARGFLRLYADYLKVPAEPLLALWEGKPYPPPESAPTAATVAAKNPVPSRPRSASAASVTSEANHANEVNTLIEPAVELDPSDADVIETLPISPVLPVDLPIDPVDAFKESQALFSEIGHSLKKQREILSLSLTEVERYTRLRQRYLHAMESGHFEDLPSTVQGRGMLSNYATFLNLDSETILLHYAEALQLRRIERTPPAEEPGLFKRKRPNARQVSLFRRLLTPDLLIGGGLILVLFVFIVWTAARISSVRETAVKSTLPSVGQVLMSEPTNTATLSLTHSPEPNLTAQTTPSEGGGEVQVTDITPNTPEVATAAATGIGVGTPEGTPGSPSSLLTPTIAVINNDPLQIYIVSRQRAFLQVSIDGAVKFIGRTDPGTAYPYSAKKSIDILMGNAAAFQVYYNQIDMGSLGGVGQVQHLTFTDKGVTTPTPLPTATASPTPAISPTSGPSPTVLKPTVTPLIPN